MMHAELAPAADAPDASDAPFTRKQLAIILFGCWLIACAIVIAMSWQDIVTLSYPDPDDQLRLVEVRDWLFGQSWWDVSQHRINPPTGGLMHWSRYVDVPIALAIVLLRPLLGYAAAQTIAAILIPLVTLGATMAAAALLTRRLLDREAAILAALLVCATPGALTQMRPLRVDHHGWQIAFAVAAMFAVLDRRPWRSGVVTGLLVSMWLRISLEGLPLAGAIGVLVGLRWALAPTRDEDGRLVGFFAALAIGSLLLFGGAIPASQWPLAWCDSISAPHLGMFAAAGAGSVLLRMVPPLRLPRLAAGAALGALCVYVYHLGAPRCGFNPYVDLDPIVRKIWFNSVPEGLPIWKQSWLIATLCVGYPLIALVGGVTAWRAAESEHRMLWACYLFVLVAAIAGAALVQRMGGAANTLALPGGLYLLLGRLRRARAESATGRRLWGTAAAVILFAPVTPGLAALLLTPDDAATTNGPTANRACATPPNFRALDALPPSRILAPLDIGPAILLETGHSVLATGHHRNHAAMAEVLRAFMFRDTNALATVRRHDIRYVVMCAKAVEVDVYSHFGPHGLASEMLAGKPPSWLTRVTLPGNPAIEAWRVNDLAAR